MERKQPEWEKSQSVFHKDEKGYSVMENAYGSLNYVKESTHQNQEKKGFVLEAKEAPGTAGHTEKEKRFHPEIMKKVKMKTERFLYTSELPFRDQAVFYDISEWEQSKKFIDCLKDMIEMYDHRTLKETFGFLDQRSERLWKEYLEQKRTQGLMPGEVGPVNRQIDSLNAQLWKKEAKERQLRTELQFMIDRRKEEEKKTKGQEKYSRFIPVQVQMEQKATQDGADSTVLEEEENGKEQKIAKSVKKQKNSSE